MLAFTRFTKRKTNKQKKTILDKLILEKKQKLGNAFGTSDLGEKL